MPTVSFHNLGAIGIVKDTPEHLLPPEAWTDGKNVRFQDNKVVRFSGHAAVFDPPTIAPYWALFCPTATAYQWLYAGLNDVYTFDGSTHTRISKSAAAYNANAVELWSGGLLGGIPIINNSGDVPQMWNPISSGTLLADLSNWTSTKRAKIFKPFKAFGVAFNLTETGVEYPHKVLWSHPADPGAVPASWDITDATRDAGETELTDAHAGVIQDAHSLRDLMIIYKDTSTWGMQYVGGQFIFRFFPILTSSGILTKDCVNAMPDGLRHVVANGDDLIIHDGQSAESIINRRYKRWLNNNIDTTNFDRSFLFVDHRNEEVVFAFPQTGGTWPDLSLVVNIRSGEIGVRDFANISFVAPGVVSETVDGTWASDSDTWAADVTAWNTSLFGPHSDGLLMCNPEATKLYQYNSGNQFAGANFQAYVERQGLAIIGRDRQGNPKADFTSRKLVKRIWPKISGGAISVQVGSQEVLDGTVTWAAAQTFTPGTDQYLDFSVNGRLLAVRFESTANASWEIEGYDLEIEVLGAL